MNVKPGVRTSEFWMTVVMSLVLAVLSVLVVAEVITEAESEILAKLILLVVSAVVPLAISGMTVRYTDSRTRIKAG